MAHAGLQLKVFKDCSHIYIIYIYCKYKYVYEIKYTHITSGFGDEGLQ